MEINKPPVEKVLKMEKTKNKNGVEKLYNLIDKEINEGDSLFDEGIALGNGIFYYRANTMCDDEMHVDTNRNYGVVHSDGEYMFMMVEASEIVDHTISKGQYERHVENMVTFSRKHTPIKLDFKEVEVSNGKVMLMVRIYSGETNFTVELLREIGVLPSDYVLDNNIDYMEIEPENVLPIVEWVTSFNRNADEVNY